MSRFQVQPSKWRNNCLETCWMSPLQQGYHLGQLVGVVHRESWLNPRGLSESSHGCNAHFPDLNLRHERATCPFLNTACASMEFIGSPIHIPSFPFVPLRFLMGPVYDGVAKKGPTSQNLLSTVNSTNSNS